MKHNGKGRMGRLTLVAAVAAVAGLAFAAVAFANNLDRRTANEAAKELARKDCHDTSGCEKYVARDLHRVSRHKWLGKIHVISHKNDRRYDCFRRIAIKLDHETGRIYSAESRRACTDLGPR